MISNSRVRKSDVVILEEMTAYLQKLKNQTGEEAYLEAKDALQRTGVTTRSGKTKKKIVSWE
ncbi:MAG: hypothetical protein IJ757_01490 [Clostridiales bacterium]|nr:hypothetical protein [Clostridiales bacterium]